MSSNLSAVDSQMRQGREQESTKEPPPPWLWPRLLVPWEHLQLALDYSLRSYRLVTSSSAFFYLSCFPFFHFILSSEILLAFEWNSRAVMKPSLLPRALFKYEYIVNSRLAAQRIVVPQRDEIYRGLVPIPKKGCMRTICVQSAYNLRHFPYFHARFSSLRFVCRVRYVCVCTFL
jgi:hypothetical protein